MSTAEVVVLGPGAIGCAAAAGLVDAGVDPVLATRTPFDRLVVTHPDGVIDAPATCVTDPSMTGQAGTVLLAVKAHQTASVVPWLDRLVGPDTTLVVLQNGVEHLERLRPLVDEAAVIVPAVVSLPAQRSEPGQVKITGRSRLTVPASDAANELVALYGNSFVRITATDDWTTAAWIKLLLNAASGGLCALARTPSTVFHDEGARDLAIEIMREAIHVGRAEGAQLPDELPDRIMDGLLAHAGRHRASIVVDRENGRPTEWDARNQVIVRLGERHGIDVPLNRMLATAIRMGEPASTQ